MRGLVTAIRTLTVLRVPGKEAESFASSLPWFPAVGFLVGWILFGVAALSRLPLLGDWPQLVAAIGGIAGLMLTGGLHADGLADWADGFFGSRDREKTLRIMKDSTIGAFGAMALFADLLLRWICWVRLLAVGNPLWIVVAAVVSRCVQADLAVSQPYARAEGGTAASFVRDARPWHGGAALLLAAALLGALPVRMPALVALAVGWLVSRGFGIYARRRIGGVTGDVLGACSEMVETMVLVLGALLQCP